MAYEKVERGEDYRLGALYTGEGEVREVRCTGVKKGRSAEYLRCYPPFYQYGGRGRVGKQEGETRG